jgi:hypothetical protein
MRIRPAAPIPLLAALLAGLLLAVFSPARASAATPCWLQILSDWTNHGSVTGTYPIHCYNEALRNMPEDVRDYSSAADDIFAARQLRLRELATQRRVQSAGPNSSNNSNGNGSTSRSGNGTTPDPSLYRRAIDNLGTSNADSLPIPLLVLASLGALLLITAAGAAATKRIRAHRAKPPAAGS